MNFVFRIGFAAAISFLFSSLALSQVSGGVNRCDEFMSSVVASSDRRALTYSLPSWQDGVEQAMNAMSPNELQAWTPSDPSIVKVVGNNAQAWCRTWRAGRNLWVLWVAMRTAPDGSTEAMAFADEVGTVSDSTNLVVMPLADGSLSGFRVSCGAKHPLSFVVPDVAARMDLRIITDIAYSKERKLNAEESLRKALADNYDLLSDDLSGFPELMVAESPKEEVRFVTYLSAAKDFTSHCGGWLVLKGKKNKVVELIDASKQVGQPELAILTPKSWYGALVTRVIPFSVGKKSYYLIEGFKGADALVKRRVVDILHVENGTITFGAKLFLHPRETYRRRIFTYSVRASMSTMYDEKSHMFVMDHLEPSDPLLTGQFAFYGPDLSYDAYLLTPDGWKFQNDIQITVENGPQPNAEIGTTASDLLSQPGSGNKRQNTGTSSSWGHGQQRTNGANSGSKNSWFDKGKGNSSPVGRKR